MKRNDLDIDYQGSSYDYGSIMQYNNQSFSRSGCVGDNCLTMAINNYPEYSHQGQPVLGQRNGLSDMDIIQSNRLYIHVQGVECMVSLCIEQNEVQIPILYSIIQIHTSDSLP